MDAAPTPAAAGIVEGAPDRIVIRGLQLETFVGVHAFERKRRQTVRIDVEIETVPGYAGIVRRTGCYVSYEDAVSFIEAKAASGEHVELVESWAEAIAAFVLADELAAAVRVTVQKTKIFNAADGVGVTIERRRAP